MISFSGDVDDYSSGGKGIGRQIEASAQTVWSIEPSKIDVELTLRNGQELSLALSTPGEVFQRRLYSGAARATFADLAQPGLAVTMDGDTCNELDGWFRVIDIAYSETGDLRRLYFDFEHVCYDDPGALRGSADLRFE